MYIRFCYLYLQEPFDLIVGFWLKSKFVYAVQANDIKMPKGNYRKEINEIFERFIA